MGILSAFCVGTSALVAKDVLPRSTVGEIFAVCQPDFYYVAGGTGLMLIAAAFFYRQRALLAWHYGQVSLWATDHSASRSDLSEILQESDTWAGWISYQVGLWLAGSALVCYFGALLPIPSSYEVSYVVIVLVSDIIIISWVAGIRLKRDRDAPKRAKRRSWRRLGKKQVTVVAS